MSDTGSATPLSEPHATGAPPTASFYCAEVWGGNRAADSAIELPGARGWVYSRPCEGGHGGDIHYVSLCSSGLISRICLADVAGHGQTVSAVSASIHGLLRTYMNNFDQRRVLSELNRRMEEGGIGVMTTAVAVTYFPPSRFLSVSYAGHPRAWFYRAREERWSRLEVALASRPATDLPLAIDPTAEFTRRDIRIRRGDRLLLLTDGVLEAPDASGVYFGEARLAAVLEAHRHADIRMLVRALVERVCAHTGCPAVAHDDVTIVGLEFTRSPRGFGLWHALVRRLFPRRAPGGPSRSGLAGREPVERPAG